MTAELLHCCCGNRWVKITAEACNCYERDGDLPISGIKTAQPCPWPTPCRTADPGAPDPIAVILCRVSHRALLGWFCPQLTLLHGMKQGHSPGLSSAHAQHTAGIGPGHVRETWGCAWGAAEIAAIHRAYQQCGFAMHSQQHTWLHYLLSNQQQHHLARMVLGEFVNS